MLPNPQNVDNLKRMVLSSFDKHSSVKEILLKMLKHDFLLWESTRSRELPINILTIIQTYCELGLPWLDIFSSLLRTIGIDSLEEKHFKHQINFESMYYKATLQNIRKILLWHSCSRNPALPSKSEIIILIHQICQDKSFCSKVYHFSDGKHFYVLYQKNRCWELKDIYKQLVWHLE